MELNHKPGVAYSDYNVGKEMWASVAPFQYHLPGIASILAMQWRGIAALLFWLVLLAIFGSRFSASIPKLNV